MSTRFDRAIAVTPTGGGRYRAAIDDGYHVVKGPNGGYLAAIVLNALITEIDDAGRAPRSLTVHYLSAPDSGFVEIATTITKRGRSVVFTQAQMTQGDKVILDAVAAFAAPAESTSWDDVVPPEMPALADSPRRDIEVVIPIHGRFDSRPVVGAKGMAVTGGWLRLEEPRVLDAQLIAAYTDAWLPSPFVRGAGSWVPTVDLTVHFHASFPVDDVAPADHVKVLFRTDKAGEGVLVEDGRIWAPNGRLLADSRQLALLR